MLLFSSDDFEGGLEDGVSGHGRQVRGRERGTFRESFATSRSYRTSPSEAAFGSAKSRAGGLSLLLTRPFS